MIELRREYRDRLGGLEDVALEMGGRIREMLDGAVAALVARDVERAEAVVRADDAIDELGRSLEQGVLQTLALQAPVAGELRLVTGLLQINLHLIRMGDLCVNTARTVSKVGDAAASPELLPQLQDMAVHAGRLMDAAMDALRRRDLDLARGLAALDDPVDQLNAGLFRRLVQLAGADERHLDWAMLMVLVVRYLERFADHAVDIGEQILYVVTGKLEPLGAPRPDGQESASL